MQGSNRRGDVNPGKEKGVVTTSDNDLTHTFTGVVAPGVPVAQETNRSDDPQRLKQKGATARDCDEKTDGCVDDTFDGYNGTTTSHALDWVQLAGESLLTVV
ncbi:hypothetical protein GGTG_04555 [Gaeumannomyces tritici R3-111a-1]|uniref:Uncharacterized protein n=1 Tax=Gaeumannomyces tritici (strain R3-111a-1) TaxID=644352 RepID=J3NTF6_GAET3|nr:hypothetical protein GGTG_04555 [Gaeumannomyces tritici R3-111a-1]EJT79471.1 hypothetical protein GGTG_04555 [Gaeumannomyces tritici R3-111a-1]